MLQIGSIVQSTLADQQRVSGRFTREVERCIERYFERTQVAIVDADQFRTTRGGPLHFLARMDFNQRIHLQFVFGESSEARKQFIIKRSDDQQNRVRSRSSR